jgi:hypothetical protein
MKGKRLTTTKDGKIIVTVSLSSSMVKAKGSQYLDGQSPSQETSATSRKPHTNIAKDSDQRKTHKTTEAQPETMEKITTGKVKNPVIKKKTKTKNINDSKLATGTKLSSDTKPREQGDNAKPKTIYEAGGAQLVKTKKMKTFEPRFEQAITFKFNAKDTNQEDMGEGNAFWLRRAGYHEEEITEHLLDTFKRVFCRRFKPAAEVLRISEEEQPWNYCWVRKKNLSADMIGILTRWLTFVKTLEKNKNTYFERIGVTSLKQRKLDPLVKRAPGYEIIQELYNESNKFFDQEGLFEEFQADPDKTIIHALFTDHDSNINFQQPHTDFDYLPCRKALERSFNYSWTAHMPITIEGSWITLWFGTGNGYTIKIPFGTVLLLRSDVIHGGGTPVVEQNTKSKKFRRLHYYLVTEDQPAYPGYINPITYDGLYSLSDLHVQITRSEL